MLPLPRAWLSKKRVLLMSAQLPPVTETAPPLDKVSETKLLLTVLECIANEDADDTDTTPPDLLAELKEKMDRRKVVWDVFVTKANPPLSPALLLLMVQSENEAVEYEFKTTTPPSCAALLLVMLQPENEAVEYRRCTRATPPSLPALLLIMLQSENEAVELDIAKTTPPLPPALLLLMLQPENEAVAESYKKTAPPLSPALFLLMLQPENEAVEFL